MIYSSLINSCLCKNFMVKQACATRHKFILSREKSIWRTEAACAKAGQMACEIIFFRFCLAAAGYLLTRAGV